MQLPHHTVHPECPPALCDHLPSQPKQSKHYYCLLLTLCLKKHKYLVCNDVNVKGKMKRK